MPRDFIIRGQTLVIVRTIETVPSDFPRPLADSDITIQELGLSIPDGLTVSYKFKHKDIHSDDYGPDVPPEVMFNLAEATIKMTLVHYDDQVLETCMNQSMAGSFNGTLAGAGSLMGNNISTTEEGPDKIKNHFIGLFLVSVGDVTGLPNRATSLHFPTTYLCDPTPVETPIGVNRTLLTMTWRAIPYSPIVFRGLSHNQPDAQKFYEVLSSGSVLWDYNFPAGYEILLTLPFGPIK